ncbi:glycosyltransferase [Flavobacterium myungsuense]|uniref:glycosyltransferase n=1 Tax=Flavobacterium myungsuense TaxID=651823 RepID=UPI00363CDBA7
MADYIRAKVLFEHGGIYMDTDMLLLKPINQLLYYDFFISNEVQGRVAFGMFGVIEKHRFLKHMLDYYNQTEFNVFSPPIITHTFSPMINEKTVLENEVIFPPEYFYALTYENKDNDFTLYVGENSVAVHLWDHSWKKSQEVTIMQLIKNCLTVIFDYVFFGYSYIYFRRYFKEFSRKIYHVLKSRL